MPSETSWAAATDAVRFSALTSSMLLTSVNA
jgi:hypothetical protein